MIAGKEEIERQKVFGRDHFVYEENSYFIDVNDDSERMWFQNRIGVPNYKWFQELSRLLQPVSSDKPHVWLFLSLYFHS